MSRISDSAPLYALIIAVLIAGLGGFVLYAFWMLVL